MSTMQYFTNEVALTLPDDEIGDNSFNAIRMPRLKASLIVSRGILEEGESLESSFDKQLQNLQRQVKDLRYEPKTSVALGPEGALQGFETRNQFIAQGKERVYQYQAAFIVPGTRQMMALSYTKSEPLTDADAEHWASIKAGLRIRTK